MRKLYIIHTEPIPTRYTQQWRDHLAELWPTAHHIDSHTHAQHTTPGAFLDFANTNRHKSDQAQQVATLFSHGAINPGDRFLFTDAWNPTVLQLRYQSDLLRIPVSITGLWHAGSYDPNDFLGRLIGADPWVRHTEQAMAHGFTHNLFATEYHRELFCRTLKFPRTQTARMAWPMSYIPQQIPAGVKRDLIVFPHRIAPEKQVRIFKDLRKRMPEYEWVICQERSMSKAEYHQLLAEAKIVFSANLQETLGISWYEGICAGATPVVPHRLSYAEMAPNICYPSEWTRDWSAYCTHATKITKWIRDAMSMDCTQRITQTARLQQQLEPYFSSDQLKGFMDAQ